MPNTIIDLHLHTYYSDGTASPAELLYAAYDMGLRTIAITDHDNLNAYPEATTLARRLGLELVTGIELTTRWTEPNKDIYPPVLARDIDILGYYFNPNTNAIRSFASQALEDIHARIKDACQLLSEAGHPISFFDVQDENQRYHGARQLIQALNRRGITASWDQGAAMFNNIWSQVRLSRFTIQDAIQIIHAVGGVAILAHPVAVATTAGWLQESHVAWLVDLGLDGLEIYHPRMDRAARRHFRQLAQQFGLLITGGSDEHGGNGNFPRLGSEVIPNKLLKAMFSKASAQSDV